VTAKAPVVASKRNGVDRCSRQEGRQRWPSWLNGRFAAHAEDGLRIYNAAIARLLPQGKR